MISDISYNLLLLSHPTLSELTVLPHQADTIPILVFHGPVETQDSLVLCPNQGVRRIH